MGAPLRVLMIEDSQTDVELVVRVLRLGGYDVAYERVDTVAALRAALDRQSWDVIISDHSIPRLSAPAALAVLKKKHPDLPVIVVSDKIDLDLAVALMKAGVHDYVQKGELVRLVPAIARELKEVEARRKRKQAEEALRESEQRFRQLAEENAHLLEQARQDAATKATLLDEVNHRVKNNLASILGILALEAQHPIKNKADYQTALQEIRNRIQGMATVHEMLSATHWSPLPLVSLVERVIHEALSNSPLRQNILVTITPPAEPVLIAPRQATALALIVNELTTNSLKHAFLERGGGQIQVRIAAEVDNGLHVRLEFRNDGPDWPQDVLDGQRENVGLRLVRATVRSPLRGELVLRSDHGAVTLVTFRLAPAASGPGQERAEPNG